MTVCNKICPFNRSGLCGKGIVILNNGLCSEWWDKHGAMYKMDFINQNYEEYMRNLRSNEAGNQQFPHQQDPESAIEEKELKGEPN